MSLERDILQAVERDGLEELIVRISRYANLSRAIEEPAAWQAIAKYSGRASGPWGVAIRDNPVSAITAALEEGRRQASSITADEKDIFG